MASIRRADRITERTSQRVFFSDFKTEFDLVNFRDLQVVTNEADIMQSVHNLIMTNYGERLYNPLYGCNLRSLLFEDISVHTESLMREHIRTAIENFEPRVKIQDILVEGSADDNTYYVAVTFSVINRQEPITMDFVLTRIR